MCRSHTLLGRIFWILSPTEQKDAMRTTVLLHSKPSLKCDMNQICIASMGKTLYVHAERLLTNTVPLRMMELRELVVWYVPEKELDVML